MQKTNTDKPTEVEPRGPEGVPVDAPDNTAPAISPHAVTRMPRAESDQATREHSPEFSDEKNIAIDDRVSGEAWIPGVTPERETERKPKS